MNENIERSCNIRLPMIRKEFFNKYIKVDPLVENSKAFLLDKCIKRNYNPSKSLSRNKLNRPAKKYIRGKYKHYPIDDYSDNNFSENSPLKYPINPFACVKKPPVKREHKLDELIKLPSIRKDSSISPRAKFFKTLANAFKNQAIINARRIHQKADSIDISPIIKRSRQGYSNDFLNDGRKMRKISCVDNLRSMAGELDDMEDMKSIEKKIEECVKLKRDRNLTS